IALRIQQQIASRVGSVRSAFEAVEHRLTGSVEFEHRSEAVGAATVGGAVEIALIVADQRALGCASIRAASEGIDQLVRILKISAGFEHLKDGSSAMGAAAHGCTVKNAVARAGQTTRGRTPVCSTGEGVNFDRIASIRSHNDRAAAVSSATGGGKQKLLPEPEEESRPAHDRRIERSIPVSRIKRGKHLFIARGIQRKQCATLVLTTIGGRAVEMAVCVPDQSSHGASPILSAGEVVDDSFGLRLSHSQTRKTHC